MWLSRRLVSLSVGVVACAAFVFQGVAAQSPSIPVVPGAVGVGIETRAAYGGSANPTVYRVTNLNDSGPGSLRDGVTAAGARVVIFEISGTVALNSDVYIGNPYLTVAGQTAPSPGITVKNFGFFINTNDVLLQHFRVRPGAGTCNSGLQVYGGNQQNIVLDHMSFSWGQDETLAFAWTNGQSTDAVVWRSIMAEGLSWAPGSSGCSGGGASNGHGLLIAASAGRVSVIQSLVANNYERNPYMQSDTAAVLINNLIYQWHGPWGFFFNNANVSSNGAGGPWYASAVGNRFVKGPHSTDGGDPQAYMFVYSVNSFGNAAGNKIYKSDNTLANQDGTVVLEANQYSYNPSVSSPPAEAAMPGGFTPLASTAVEEFVLANAGSRPMDRDAVDARIVREVQNRAGGFVSDPNSVGGHPVLAVNARALLLPANPHTVSASGYRNLEVWLHGYAAAVEPAGAGAAPAAPTNVSAK